MLKLNKMIEIIQNKEFIKWFLLATIILIVLKIIEYIAFNFTNHRLSRLGFKERNNFYTAYGVYSRLYFIVLIIISFILFIEWFKTI